MPFKLSSVQYLVLLLARVSFSSSFIYNFFLTSFQLLFIHIRESSFFQEQRKLFRYKEEIDAFGYYETNKSSL